MKIIFVSMGDSIRFIFLCSVFLLLTGCSTYPLLSDSENDVVSRDYLIGPGDNVDIIVWRNPDYRET